MAALMAAGGLYLLLGATNYIPIALLLLVASLVLVGLSILVHHRIFWRLTSDRLIESRDLFATSLQEMELADIRSIDVSQSLRQRLLSLGMVSISSAASSEFLIVMSDIPNSHAVAETIRKARLKRLG